MLSVSMDLSQLFRTQDLLVDFAPDDKWDAIAKLVRHLADSGRLPAGSVDAVLEQVLARERSMSTGMEAGIAVPHAAVEDVSEIAAAMGIVKRAEGLAFESIDGRPTRLVVLLVIPKAQKLLHIRTLADVARVLGHAEARDALLAARTPEDAWAALREGEFEAR